MIRRRLNHLLAYPLTEGLDLDNPALTELRKTVLLQKTFLNKIYQEWYSEIARQLPEGPGQVLELGSGAGFLEKVVSGLIKSEIFWLPGVDLVLDGSRLPFAENQLKAIVMTNVLHHIPDSRRFFAEACRCLRCGGVVAMVEPWFTPWSGWVYRRLHHEPFDPQAVDWEFPSSGPLSGANGALPWILFERDREQFLREFRNLEITVKKPFLPFRYLLSGGISMKSLVPLWTYDFWKTMENWCDPWMDRLGLFALVVVKVSKDVL